VHAYYGKSHIVHGVDLEVNEGEVVGLLGRNGVGKSTLLKGIMRVVPPNVPEGKIAFKDRDITRIEPHKVSLLGVGYVPEERRIFPHLNVIENLSLGLDVQGKSTPEKKEVLEEIYAHFPRLAERKKQLGESLSGGEQQMLAIARTMAMRPELILMDEPTEGLMPLLVKEIANILRVLKGQGVAVLLVEQSAVTALEVSDRIYVMEKGVIRFEGTPQELQENKLLVKELLAV